MRREGPGPRRPPPLLPEPAPRFNLIEFVRGARTELSKACWPLRGEVSNWASVATWVILVTIALALLFDLFAAAALDWLRP